MQPESICIVAIGHFKVERVRVTEIGDPTVELTEPRISWALVKTTGLETTDLAGPERDLPGFGRIRCMRNVEIDSVRPRKHLNWVAREAIHAGCITS